MSYLHDAPWDEPLVARCRCGEEVSSGGECPVCDAAEQDDDETGEDYDLADLEDGR